ncbi:1670_t:CDS:10 [Entrophospora sp. SA101]|nr:1670_t:CDS:10 [Entrophospora sp. SA101]
MESGYRSAQGLKTLKVLNMDRELIPYHTEEEIEWNLNFLKTKLDSPFVETDTNLYGSIRESLESEPCGNMRCDMPVSITFKCDEIVAHFDDSDISRNNKNIFHNKTWKEDETELVKKTECILNIYGEIQSNPAFKTTPENLPPVLQNRKTATLVLKTLKKDKNMPALVFEWNQAGYNDVPTALGSQNGIAGQNKGAIVKNLMANGAGNYNNVVFTFPNGTAIGAWHNPSFLFAKGQSINQAFQMSALQSPELTRLLLNVMNVTHAHPQHLILRTFHIVLAFDFKHINKDKISSSGLIPYLHKLHSTQGCVVKSGGPLFGNTISVTDPLIIKSTLSIGDRPNFLFKFLEPMFGQDNLQIFEADRAAKFHKPQDLDLKAFKKGYDIVLGGLFDKQIGMLEAPREEEVQNSINYLQETLRNLISIRKEKINVDGEDILVKDMLDINMFISVFVVAGYHSTGIAISWTIFELTQNLEIQKKLQKEIDQVLKCHLPTFEDLSKMDYLTQVVKESLRVHPPGAFCARFLKSDMNVEKNTTTTKSSLSSSTIEPHKIDNSLLLKSNTTILYPIPLLHENPNFFENPLEFKPSRFATTTNTIKPSTYCPFGFGARICPAERLALLDVKMMICLIFQKFNVELAMNLNDVQKEEKFAIMAKNDILVKLTLRNK